jgi:hypothetical protein
MKIEGKLWRLLYCGCAVCKEAFWQKADASSNTSLLTNQSDMPAEKRRVKRNAPGLRKNPCLDALSGLSSALGLFANTRIRLRSGTVPPRIGAQCWINSSRQP